MKWLPLILAIIAVEVAGFWFARFAQRVDNGLVPKPVLIGLRVFLYILLAVLLALLLWVAFGDADSDG
ncbi:MAG: hypothetical protein ACYSWT_11525 [Planctomycetota bacterium]|jgi:hypothetical protein